MGLAYNPKVVTDGLVLYLDAANPKSYPGTGSKWLDMSSNGYHAALNTSYQTFNVNNSGYISFISDGSTAQGAIIGNNVASLLSATNTVEFTMYKTNSQGQILTNNFYGYGESDRVFAKTGTTSLEMSPAYNTWQHYAMTYDAASLTMSIYKNGEFLRSSGGFDMSGLSGSVYLGSRPWAATAQNFRLGILKIYSRILPVGEIITNFNATRSRYGI